MASRPGAGTPFVTVRYGSGTNQTNTISGQRASSTSGYQAAAESLARKLFPGRTVGVVKFGGPHPVSTQVFQPQPAPDEK